MSARRQSLAMAGLLIALTGLLTWPLARTLGSALPDLGDPLLNSWILAWDFHALRHHPLRFFDANIFYPHPWTLAYTEPLLGLVPLALPAALLGADPVLLHNLVLVATFPLSGLLVFWLVRHLTGQSGAACVAGILYAFSHYRFSHLGHIQLLSHEWLPLLLLGLHRAVTRGAPWRDVALAAFAFAAQVLSSGYYGYFAAITVGVFLVWLTAPAGRPPLGRLARRGIVAAAVTTAILAPLLFPYVLARRDVDLTRPMDEVRAYSARPSAYLAAAPDNRWFGDLTAPLRRPEGTLFPGAVTLILAAAGAITALSPPPSATEAAHRVIPVRGSAGRPWPRVLDLVLAAFLLLTLGNALVLGGFVVHVGAVRVGQRRFGGSIAVLAITLAIRRLVHGRAVPITGLGWLRRLGWPHTAGCYVLLTLVGLLCSLGPTLWLFDRPVAEPLYRQLYELLPGFDGLRVPARFAVVASTGLAVLAGYGAAETTRRLRRPAARVALISALGFLAAAEAWAVPITLVPAPTEPGPADRWLAAVPDAGAVVMLPMYRKPDAHLETRRLIGSVAHWRPLVNGYAGFFPRGYWELVDTLNAFPDEPALRQLRALGVRYVVLYLGQFPEHGRRRVEAALRAFPPGLAQVASFEHTAILELRPLP